MSSSRKADLRLDWCSYEAAKFAVMHWHYSKAMPRFRLATMGVWECDKFVGSVIFGLGATPMLLRPYGLVQFQGCELLRVALRPHATPTSRIVAIATRVLKRRSPGLRIIVSFADAQQGHVGTIYQAAGWTYTGESIHSWLRVAGRVRHPRAIVVTYGTQALPWLREHVDPVAAAVSMPPKYRYVCVLDKSDNALVARVAAMRKPYPKRAGSIGADVPAHQAGEGGSTPTPALHSQGDA